MSSVVLELQQEALDRKAPVSGLLRKALVVARKLGLQDFEAWVSKELSGYGDDDGDSVPAYRIVNGQVRAWNPYNGWVPVIFKDPQHGEMLSQRACGQSVAEIESLIEAGTAADTSIHMPL